MSGVGWRVRSAAFDALRACEVSEEVFAAVASATYAVLKASVDRSPEGGNHEDGCRAKHESAVPERQTPNPSRQDTSPSSKPSEEQP